METPTPMREPPPEAEVAALKQILDDAKKAQAEYAHFSQDQARAPR